jgi:hypothetical protein
MGMKKEEPTRYESGSEGRVWRFGGPPVKMKITGALIAGAVTGVRLARTVLRRGVSMVAARSLSPVALFLSALAVFSCSDSPTDTDEVRVPAALDIVSGDGQEGVVGSELPNPLVVRVKDASGLPVIGQLVNFRVTAGGGSVFAGSGLTNAEGIVQDRWTIGTSTADTQRVEARAVDPNTGQRLVFATFRATPRPGPAHSVTKIAGDAQQAPLGAALAESLAVRVADSFGNPIPNVAVTWAASAGNGAVSPGTSQTNAQGIAKTRWTLGARLDIPHGVTATVAALAPAAFTANATLPASATIAKLAGDGATGTVGVAMAESLAVRVQLAGGQVVPGVQVSWQVASGNGSIVPQASVTQADGIARARFTPGNLAGANVVTASVAGISPAQFTITGTAGAPAALTKISGDGQQGSVGQQLSQSIVVQVADAFGNTVPNVNVSWNASAGTVNPANGPTDTGGNATAGWTLGEAAGAQTLTASVTGLTSAQFTAQARPGPVAALSVVGGSGQSGTAGTTLPAPVEVQATDRFGNSVDGATITFNASHSGSFSPATATTNASGRAASQWTLGGAAGAQTATISNGAVVVTATATAASGAATTLTIVSGNAQEGIAGDPLSQPLVVRVTDANANAVSGVGVTWTPGSSCGSVSPTSSVTDENGAAQATWTLGTSGRACVGGVTASATGASPVVFTAHFLGRTAERIDAGNFVEQVATIDVPITLVFMVTDASENPVPGITVSWTRTEGNGTPASSSSVTDSFGRAGLVFTPGTIAGSNRIVASVTGVGSAEYHVWTRALEPERTVIVSGDGQTGAPGQKLPQPLVVRVEDKYGNGVYNVPVLFQVQSGGGHIELTRVATNEIGRASAVWALGSLGPQQVAVSAASGVTFTATGVEGTGDGLLIAGGNEQRFTLSFQTDVFLAPVSARVVNGRGEPLSGVPVTWNVQGVVSTVTSDAAGLATLTNARIQALSVGPRSFTATLPNGSVATMYAIIVSGGGGAFGAPSHTGPTTARVGRRLQGRVVVACADRMGAPAPCSIFTRDASLNGSGGQVIPAPGLFPPGRSEYFWIMPETPGTYYFVVSASAGPNQISATAVP